MFVSFRAVGARAEHLLVHGQSFNSFEDKGVYNYPSSSVDNVSSSGPASTVQKDVGPLLLLSNRVLYRPLPSPQKNSINFDSLRNMVSI